MTTDANLTVGPSLPTTGGGMFSSASTPLPKDVLERARDRVYIAALVFVATWIVVVVMNEGIARFAPPTPLLLKLWAPRQTILTLVGLVVSLGMAWIAKHFRHRPELVLDWGLGFEVFNALLVSLITEWYPRHDPQAVSWVCVTIVLWPAIAPSSPRKTLVAALAAATTIPRIADSSYIRVMKEERKEGEELLMKESLTGQQFLPQSGAAAVQH